MKYFLVLYFLALIFSSCHGIAGELALKIGETQFIKSSGKAWIEKAKIIQVTEQRNGFQLKGLRPGSSLVKLGGKSFEVDVLSPVQERTWIRLQAAIAKTLNLELKIKSGKIRVFGKLLRWQDWDTLYRSCENRDCEYSLETTFAPEVKAQIARQISQLFMRLGLPPQNLLFENQVRALVDKKNDQSSRIAKTLKALGIEVIESKNSVELAPLVKVQITVAEVKRSETLKYGIDWPSSYSAKLLPKVTVGTDSQALTIQALEEQGLAKVLATPTLLCRSGKSASFLAGGEFPIKIVNFKTQDVIWKKYGILLKIAPLADYSGKMSISIETEVSSIDPSHTVDGVPGLYTNRIQSYFDLSESRTIALSGLIKSEQSEASSGLPALSRIPILGALFSSKDFRENRTELVVFVKPEVVSPGTLEVN